MARPKEWVNGVAKTIMMEDYVASYFETSDIKPGKALEEWLETQIPRGQTAADYLATSLQKQIEFKSALRAERHREIDAELDPEIDSLRRKKELLLVKSNQDADKLKELWKQWRAEKSEIEKPNEAWKENTEESIWWVRRNYPLTYRDLYRLWPEMEGIS